MSDWPSDTAMIDWLSADDDRIRQLWLEVQSGRHAELREAIATLMPEGLTIRSTRMRGRSGR